MNASRVLLRWLNLVLVAGMLAILPACNPAPDVPAPKTQSRQAYSDDADDAQLRTAIFSYKTHKGRVDDDDDKPLVSTVVHVTT